MDQLKGRRFVFGVVSVLAISVVTVLMKYDGEVYFKLIGLITGLFMVSQSYTDSKKIDNGKP